MTDPQIKKVLYVTLTRCSNWVFDFYTTSTRNVSTKVQGKKVSVISQKRSGILQTREKIPRKNRSYKSSGAV